MNNAPFAHYDRELDEWLIYVPVFYRGIGWHGVVVAGYETEPSADELRAVAERVRRAA